MADVGSQVKRTLCETHWSRRHVSLEIPRLDHLEWAIEIILGPVTGMADRILLVVGYVNWE